MSKILNDNIVIKSPEGVCYITEVDFCEYFGLPLDKLRDFLYKEYDVNSDLYCYNYLYMGYTSFFIRLYGNDDEFCKDMNKKCSLFYIKEKGIYKVCEMFGREDIIDKCLKMFKDKKDNIVDLASKKTISSLKIAKDLGISIDEIYDVVEENVPKNMRCTAYKIEHFEKKINGKSFEELFFHYLNEEGALLLIKKYNNDKVLSKYIKMFKDNMVRIINRGGDFVIESEYLAVNLNVSHDKLCVVIELFVDENLKEKYGVGYYLKEKGVEVICNKFDDNTILDMYKSLFYQEKSQNNGYITKKEYNTLMKKLNDIEYLVKLKI